MYCGGSPPNLVVCPKCGHPWGKHAKTCQYYDAVTAILNAKPNGKKID